MKNSKIHTVDLHADEFLSAVAGEMTEFELGGTLNHMPALLQPGRLDQI